MHSAIYEGIVRHCRFSPRRHEFDYRLYLMYLDLAELDLVFRGRWLWSATGPALAWFRRADHLGNPSQPLDQSVRDLVERQLGNRPSGPIRLLTQLRYYGYVMNPVSFYYCFDSADLRVESVVAEVHNTPWGEEHCYVLDFREQSGARQFTNRHPKNFHVSPFMGMDMDYAWKVTPPGIELSVEIQNRQRDDLLFTAKIDLRRQAISGWKLNWLLLRFPWITMRVFLAIYWQAVRLWLKKVPYVPHPGTTTEKEIAECDQRPFK